MSIARHHAEWLSLVEVSGPFLSMPVLLEAFPTGLEAPGLKGCNRRIVHPRQPAGQSRQRSAGFLKSVHGACQAGEVALERGQELVLAGEDRGASRVQGLSHC